jgi:hypothetical protein
MYYAGQTVPNVGHLYSKGSSGVNRAVLANKLADTKNPSGRMRRNGAARPLPTDPFRSGRNERSLVSHGAAMLHDSDLECSG